MQTTSYRQCDPNRSLIITNNAHGTIVYPLFIINGYIEVKEDIRENISLSRSLESCAINQPLLPCSPFGKYDIPNFCEALQRTDNMFGRYFVEKVEPKLTCPPLKKGHYNLLNITIDLTPFFNLPVENKEWKQQATAKTLKSEKVVFCATSSAKIFAQSSRKRV